MFAKLWYSLVLAGLKRFYLEMQGVVCWKPGPTIAVYERTTLWRQEIPVCLMEQPVY